MQAQPIQVDLPHNLGREEAQRRIAANIHKLQGYIPGGAEVTSNWQGSQLSLAVGAMGQNVDARIEVEEKHVRCHILLPGLLGLMAKPIEAMLRNKGGELLLEDRTKG